VNVTAQISASDIPLVLAEIQTGDGLSLSAAGRLFPGHRGGGTVDPSTAFRWVTRGAKATDGTVVKLEAVRVGGRWITSRGAVARFVAALTAAAYPASTPAPKVTNSPASQRSERAAAKLKEKGA